MSMTNPFKMSVREDQLYDDLVENEMKLVLFDYRNYQRGFETGLFLDQIGLFLLSGSSRLLYDGFDLFYFKDFCDVIMEP